MSNSNTSTAAPMEMHAPATNGTERVLTPAALAFLTSLQSAFITQRNRLLNDRKQQQLDIAQGKGLDFNPDTADIRNTDWKVAPVPASIQDRRVEITGPTDRKMMINALNSGAKVFMADLEDSNTPTWENLIQGQINLQDAVRGTIAYTSPEGKEYTLNATPATLMVRARGWHMDEKHITIGGASMSASLFDFGLYLWHNAHELLARGSGPFFYLPKLESYKEARLWNDVFDYAEEYLQLEKGTIKATVLIETIPAVFQLNEILWELRDHAAGLNCGRWDYIFSFIKKYKDVPNYLFPDRSQITMTVPFMRAYTQLVVQTCHRRGAHAIGGMAAQIPIRNNAEANAAAMEKVKQDKTREAKDGHDGTWVAHPGLVPIAMDIFNELMPGANQKEVLRADFHTTTAELLALPTGTITEDGLRTNINVGILYLESWLRGNGAAAIYNLMEDAATAEISRTQVWQWVKNKATLADGRTVTNELYEQLVADELQKIAAYVGNDAFAKGRFAEAIALFNELVLSPDCPDFLTTSAYNKID